MNIDSFIEIVDGVCRRRRMYVLGGTFEGVCAYFLGYADGSPDCPLSGDGWSAFNGYVCATFRFPNKYWWPYVIRQCFVDDEEATDQLRHLLTEFAHKSKTQRYDKIEEEALSLARRKEEGEPEKVWRRFSSAIHRSRRAEIEPLIQEHPDAAILWTGNAHPIDISMLLDEIEDSYLIGQLSGSEDAGDVTIITPDFGPVQVTLIEGTWRIDAAKVIECRKKQGCDDENGQEE